MDPGGEAVSYARLSLIPAELTSGGAGTQPMGPPKIVVSAFPFVMLVNFSARAPFCWAVRLVTTGSYLMLCGLRNNRQRKDSASINRTIRSTDASNWSFAFTGSFRV